MSDPDAQTEATRPEPTRPEPTQQPQQSWGAPQRSSWDAPQQQYGGPQGSPAYGTPAYGTPSYAAPGAAAAGGGASAAGHVLSALVGLLVPPIALVLFDWGLGTWWVRSMRMAFDDRPIWPVLLIALGALLMLGVAAVGRVSWVGPAIAGVLYGALPFLAIVVAPQEVQRLAFDIGGDLYTYALVNVTFYGFVLFPTIGALLIGTAIASARRR